MYSVTRHNATISIYTLAVEENPARERFEQNQKAAEQGLAGAQFNLSLIYKDGSGISKNTVKAYSYFLLAKANNLDKVNLKAEEQFYMQKLTPDQKAQAEEEAAKMWESLNNNHTSTKKEFPEKDMDDLLKELQGKRNIHLCSMWLWAHA